LKKSVLARVWLECWVSFWAGPNIGKGLRKVAARVPQIDLEGKRVEPWLAVDDTLEGRIGDAAAIPIVLALNLNGRKARRQRSK
jgi:hypothetical protein